MARQLGMGILRLLAVIGGVCVLIFVVTSTGATLMPGTKVRQLFGSSSAALAGDGRDAVEGASAAAVAAAPADGGVDAGTPVGEQGAVAPASAAPAQPLPEKPGQ